MIIFSHPTGNANVRAAAEGILKAGLLMRFYISIAAFKGTMLYRFGNVRIFSEVLRREFDITLQPFTRMYPIREIGRLLAKKLGWKKLIEHEKGLFCVDAVYQSLDKHVASHLEKLNRKEGLSAVYAYEDGAAYSFLEAKRLRIQCFYDLPIGYWRAARKLLAKEIEHRPEWASTLTGFKDSVSKLNRKEKELAMADYIFVASSFTAQTLQDYNGQLAPVRVIPYGFPPVTDAKEYTFDGNRPLKLLFVGGLSQRKGIGNLFEAVNGFGDKVALTIVGHKAVDTCEALNKALKIHTWLPSLTHDDVLKLMREQDVLVFPSLFEGFGLVITEAMSQGTPVITTERTAGPDLITSGENGWIVEAGSTQALRLKIEDLLINPHQIEANGRAALETARKRPWDVYGKELAEAISSLVL